MCVTPLRQSRLSSASAATALNPEGQLTLDTRKEVSNVVQNSLTSEGLFNCVILVTLATGLVAPICGEGAGRCTCSHQVARASWHPSSPPHHQLRHPPLPPAQRRELSQCSGVLKQCSVGFGAEGLVHSAQWLIGSGAGSANKVAGSGLFLPWMVAWHAGRLPLKRKHASCSNMLVLTVFHWRASTHMHDMSDMQLQVKHELELFLLLGCGCAAPVLELLKACSPVMASAHRSKGGVQHDACSVRLEHPRRLAVIDVMQVFTHGCCAV
eukprot:1157940-Pelagomonas_calceolata.AAC.8